MPELPEVETMRRGLQPLVGKVVVEIGPVACRYRPLHVSPSWSAISRRIKGGALNSIERWGKRLLFHFPHGRTLVVEPRMTGLLVLVDPPSESAIRWQIAFRGMPPDRLYYWDRRGLGTVRLLDRAALREERRRIGPDALEMDVNRLREALRESRRAIKVALLDQSRVAGIGNIYAAEMLHRARISPARSCREVTDRQWVRLQQAMQQTLKEAIRYEGSTLSDGTYRNALSRQGTFQHRHRVYAKENQRCGSCGRGIIRRMVQQQRSTFYCPVCQR